MNNDIIQCIKLLQERKAEINAIDKRIIEERIAFEEKVSAERKEFEESLKPLKENLIKLSEKFDVMGQNTVPISLGELVNELADLKGISASDIEIEIKSNIEFYGKCSLNRILELFRLKNMQGARWDVILTDKSTNIPSFCYKMTFKLNFDAIQADGKTFFEHCTNEIRHNFYNGDNYTVLCIRKNRNDIILNIPLYTLLKGDYNGVCDEKWYPANLMTQAVMNCVEKSYQEETSKKRSRVLTNK